jgi:hypothetical protein
MKSCLTNEHSYAGGISAGIGGVMWRVFHAT